MTTFQCVACGRLENDGGAQTLIPPGAMPHGWAHGRCELCRLRTQSKEQEDCPLCFEDFRIDELDRTLVAAFMCGMSAVMHGTPALLLEVLCQTHGPLVLDAMAYSKAFRFGDMPKTPEAHARDIAAAQAKRERKARR